MCLKHWQEQQLNELKSKVGPPHRILLRWDPAKVIARPATSLGNYADLFRVLIENLDLFVVRGNELMPITFRLMCPSPPLPIPLATITSKANQSYINSCIALYGINVGILPAYQWDYKCGYMFPLGSRVEV